MGMFCAIWESMQSRYCIKCVRSVEIAGMYVCAHMHVLRSQVKPQVNCIQLYTVAAEDGYS